jgi:hypothetical protein
MPDIAKLKYEFLDHDEAHSAFANYAQSQPPNVAEYPKFVIDYVDVEQHDTLVLWLRLVRDK